MKPQKSFLGANWCIPKKGILKAVLKLWNGKEKKLRAHFDLQNGSKSDLSLYMEPEGGCFIATEAKGRSQDS